MRVIPVLVLSLVGAGCGGGAGRIYYDTTGLEHDPIAKQDRAKIRAAAAEAWGGRIVRVSGPDGKTRKVTSKSALEKLPSYVLWALYMVHEEHLHGGEFDVRVRQKGGPSIPVSVAIDLEGHARVRYGKAPKKPEQAPTLEALRKKYATGQLDARGGTRWGATSRRALGLAFQALTTEERAVVLKRLRFVRTPGSGQGQAGGKHYVEGCKQRVEIYDRAFLGQKVRFAGRPSSPMPSPALTMLHEIGHVLHARPGRLTACRAEQAIARSKKATAAYNKTVKRYNAAKSEVDQRNLAKRLEEQGKEQRRLVARANELVAKAEKLTGAGPVLKAYRKVLGTTPAPTKYGEESTAESFAESFALFHADPDALKRVAPKVHRWFAREGHLEALGADRVPSS